MRTALLLGRDHHELGSLAAVAEGPAAITLSRGGARKTYDHTEPNEDAALFALGEAGALIAVADGHHGASGSETALEYLLANTAAAWTAPGTVVGSAAAWREMALDALLACNRAILERSAKTSLPPAPTTLSLALARPGEDLLVHACVGDSHCFRASAERAVDLGWASLDRRHTYFLGYEAETREREREKCLVGCQPLSGTRAVVLATDGLSEAGIGVECPASSVREAVDEASRCSPELRPLVACKRVGQAALDAQRRQQAGDNIGCAVLWLAS